MLVVFGHRHASFDYQCPIRIERAVAGQRFPATEAAPTMGRFAPADDAERRPIHSLQFVHRWGLRTARAVTF